MWRSFAVVLFLGVSTSTINLNKLDPMALQTVYSKYVQRMAARDVIEQYFPREKGDFFVIVESKWFKDKKDSVSLTVEDGRLFIKASTGVAAVWGFNYYLKKYLKSQIEWQTKNVHNPKILPFVNETITANDRFRYYQNVNTASYSSVWWTLEKWKKHISWMALNGINLALAPVAQEAAWTRVYRKIGLTQEEIDQYFTGPAFLSMHRGGHMHGWGGPLPQSWHDLQTSIQKEVIRMMLNLGIVPVLPAFNGHVPVAVANRFDNSKFYKTRQCNNNNMEYCRDLFIDPVDPLFIYIGKLFLRQIKTYGIHIYTADPFSETSRDLEYLAVEIARATFTTLTKFDKDAVWLLPNSMFFSSETRWPLDKAQSLFNAVPSGRMLILDMRSEQLPQYDLYKMYFGQPFIWCMLHNFGGTLGMHGNMVTINKDVYQVRARGNSTMIGIGLTPEGINQNYVVYDLMLESAWRKSPVEDLNAWITDYAERRHGCQETGEAWKYLLKSVYSYRHLNRTRSKNVVTRRPSLQLIPGAWYRSYDLFQAFRKLVFANQSKCATEGYRYDVVDVTRQALQYRVDQLYLKVVQNSKENSFVFEQSIELFLDALLDMSSILFESKYFLAETWFAQARALGTTEDESYLYEMNARNQITLFGPRPGEMSDYACKQWAEVVRDYYRPRWQTFLNAALRAKLMREEFKEQETRDIIVDTVEIPYFATFNSNIARGNSSEPILNILVAKNLYRKWAYAPEANDLRNI